MSIPLPLPDWLPPWFTTVLLIIAVLYGLAFLFMPFSVIGVKSRLETIEAELEAIHTELRSLTLRLPENPPRGAEAFATYVAPEPLTPHPAPRPVPSTPPIPPREPPAYRPAPEPGLRAGGFRPSAPASREEERSTSRRAEPRLEWRP